MRVRRCRGTPARGSPNRWPPRAPTSRRRSSWSRTVPARLSTATRCADYAGSRTLSLEDPIFPRREHGTGRSPSDALVIDHICVGAVAALEALAPRRAPAVVCLVLDMVDIVDRHGVDEPAALVDPELPVEPAGFHPAT